MDHARRNKERTIIDKQIARLRNTIRILNTHRNALSPISVLPVEILSAIFIDILMNATTPDSRSILAITHVCEHWREVAIACPTLWTQVVLGNLKYQPEMVERAKSLPMVLRIHASPFIHASVADFISTSFHRVQNLVIEPTALIEAVIHNVIDSPAPLLHTATLQCSTQTNVYSQLGPALFNGNTPGLHNLTLAGIRIDWSLPVFSQLTILRLERVPSRGGLLIALKSMQKLKYLELIRIEWDFLNQSSESIHLPALLNMKILFEDVCEDVWSNFFIFIHQFCLPSKATIDLFVTSYIFHPNSAIQSPPLCPDVTDLQVHWQKACVTLISLPYRVTIPEPPKIATLFAKVAQSLVDCSRLKSIHCKMITESRWTTIDWVKALEPMVEVEAVYMNLDNTGRRFLQALAFPPTRRLPNSSLAIDNKPALLPSLRDLSIVLDLDAYFCDIRDALLARKEQGLQIAKLDIMIESHAENLTPSEIQELRGLVGMFCVRYI